MAEGLGFAAREVRGGGTGSNVVCHEPVHGVMTGLGKKARTSSRFLFPLQSLHLELDLECTRYADGIHQYP